MFRPCTRVIILMILVVIKLYVLSVILRVVSRNQYRAVCRNCCSVFCYHVYVAVCNVAINVYLIFWDRSNWLKCVCGFPAIVYVYSSMHYTWRIK